MTTKMEFTDVCLVRAEFALRYKRCLPDDMQREILSLTSEDRIWRRKMYAGWLAYLKARGLEPRREFPHTPDGWNEAERYAEELRRAARDFGYPTLVRIFMGPATASHS